MRKYRELSYTQLRKYYNPKQFSFSATSEISNAEGIVGQERAVKAMEFGLRVKNSRYNIYMAGMKGIGKTSYAQKVVTERAKSENVPDDWCYVNNFDNPGRPIAVNVPPGMGKVLCEDMDELVQDLLTEIPKAFSGEDFERRKTEIIKEFQESKNSLLDELTEYSKKNGFLMKNTSTGFAFAPLISGNVISDEEYNGLEEGIRNEIERRAEEVQIKAAELLRKLKALERKAKRKIIDLGNMIGDFVVQPLLHELIDKYSSYSKVIEYLQKLQKNVIEHIYDFDTEDGEEFIVVKKTESSFTKKYKVNLFIDNSNAAGAPVVVEFNPNYSNLAGKIEYENEQGNLKTDFTMIKPGAIHKANGGYLIIQANQLLSNIQAWETLKRTLETGEVVVESLRTQLGVVDIASLKPEPIPVRIKAILIGNYRLYQLLYDYDEDFQKLFKIKVDFDSVMAVTPDNEAKLIHFIGSYCEKEGIRHLDPTGVAKVLEYNHRFSGSQKKFSTKFDKIIEMLVEADTWAELEGSSVITDRHVKKAFMERVYRNSRVEDRIEDTYREGKILLDIREKRVGRINGLSVIDVGDHVFGKPSVITVTTFAGNKGIINIEREAELSGRLHDKGVMILEGYIGEMFAQEQPLSLTAKICFEQLYSGVDGDSASSTELYGLLSSLGEIPIKQNIAVTGSVNQKGEIQPVGGVTEKIEGFFSICKYHGLSGNQGVIIPYQNVDELVLNDDIIKAVKDGKFHIYPVSKIEEGMEILTDKPFKQVYKAVKEKLEQYGKKRKEHEGDGGTTTKYK